MKTVLHRSPTALALRIFLLLFLIDTAYALLIMLFLSINPSPNYYTGLLILLWATHTAKYIATTFLLLRLLLVWLSEFYAIENGHLTIHSGIYAISEKVYDLAQLKQVKVHQDWFGRRFNFGDLALRISSSGSHETIELHDIVNPQISERQFIAEFK